MNHNIITTSSMIQNRNNQSIKGCHPSVETRRNQIVRTLQVLLTAITMLFSLGVNGAWADVNLTIPTIVLDLNNPTMVTEGNWTATTAEMPTYCLDETYLVVGVYELTRSTEQTWSCSVGGGSGTGSAWAANAPFKGATYYSNGEAKDGNTVYRGGRVNNTRAYLYRVKNCAQVKSLVNRGGTDRVITMSAYEYDGVSPSLGEPNLSTSSDGSNSNNQVLSLDLDEDKEYVIAFTANNSSNSNLYEIAFKIASSSADPDPTPEVIPFSMADEATTATAHYPTEWEAGHEVQLPQGLPEFTADNTFYINAAAYGASTSSNDNTAAIQKALNAVPAEGGMVVVPAGTWLSGPLTIKSKTVLHLKDGATLKLLPFAGVNVVPTAGSGKYPVNNSNTQNAFTYKMFLTCADYATDIVVEGEGDGSIIEGQGGDWWPNRDNMGTRPPLIRFQKGSRFLFRKFKLQNSPGTNLALSNSNGASDFTVHNVTIKNPSSIDREATADGYTAVSHNTDGIPVWGARVNIYDCLIDTGDDNIVFDSDSQYGHVWHCTFKRGHGASFGSYTERLHHIIYEDITFDGTSAGFRIKTQRGRSGNETCNTDKDGNVVRLNGSVHDIICRNAVMTNVTEPIVLTTHYDQEVDDPEHFASAAVTYQTPEYKDFLFKDITVNSIGNCYSGFNRQRPIYIYGLPELYIHDITFDNVKITGTNTAYLAYCRDIHFTNGTTITNTANPTSVVGTTYTPYEASWTGSLLPSDLAIADGKGTVAMSIDDEDKALVKGTDYTTSSEGTVTLSSNNEEVVTIVDGKIHAVGAGTAKVTISQAELAANGIYGAGEVEVTVTIGAEAEIMTSIGVATSTAPETDGTSTIVADGIVMTWAADSWNYKNNSTGITVGSETTFNNYYVGSTNSTFPSGSSTNYSGAVVEFAPEYDGYVTAVVYYQATKRPVICTASGTAVTGIVKVGADGTGNTIVTSGEVLDEYNDYNGGLKFPVTGGQKYYLGCSGSKMVGVYGFIYEYEKSGDTPDPTPTIAFEDFKIDFRVKTSEEKRYTVTLPDNGELPECVTIVNLPTTNGGQHGLNKGAKIKVHVTGPTKFTIGGCNFSTQDGISVTVGTNSPITVNNKVASCESSISDISKATYTNYEVWSYTGTEPVDILFEFKNAYLPYFFGKAIVKDWTPTWDESEQRWEIKQGATDAENGESLLEALDHLKRQTNKTLYLPNGTYDLGTNTCNVVPGGVTIKGESMEGVIIKNAPEKEGIGITATLQINDDNVTLEDLTLYCRAPYGTTPGDAAERGVCLTDRGNNNIFRHITLDGYQDTYYSWKSKDGNTSYFYDCIIKGNVDFICGSGNVWFEKCRLQVVPSHSDAQGTISSTKPYITAPSTTANEIGYVFNGCIIENATSHDMNGNYYLGRGWQSEPKAAFYNTVMKIQPTGVAFLYAMGNDKPALPCVWREMGSVLENGTPVDVSSRPSGTVLDLNEEAQPLPAVESQVVNGQLKWAAVDGAKAYNIYKDNVFVTQIKAANASAAKGMMRAAGADMTYDIPYGQEDAEWYVRAINDYGVLGLSDNEVDPDPSDTPDYSDEALVIDKTNRPFGFVTATHRTDKNSIDLSKITGGGAVTIEEALAKAQANEAGVITLKSDGVTDMRAEITDAIKNDSVIIFDGQNDPIKEKFIVSEYITIDGFANKTIIGINGARICTEFFITERYKNLLDNVQTSSGTGVTSASTASGTGGTFQYKNGQFVEVGEEEEYLTRMTLYNAVEEAALTKWKKDHGGSEEGFEWLNKEPYKNAGLFYFTRCNNFVIRNLKFEGPGSVDVGGTDLVSIINDSHHFWVDHCEFTDGIDGNFDITNGSNFITVSWCKFGYTERAYAHENTNLVGSDDNKEAMDSGKLNITFAYNEWGKGCDGRMPMARFGKIHMLNNYYTCVGNTQNAMNPRKQSEFLIEGNLWNKGVNKTYKEDGALAVTWGAGNVIKDAGGTTGTNKGTQPVTVPYQYSDLLLNTNVLPDVLSLNGGAVLGSKMIFDPNLPSSYIASTSEAKEGLTFSVWVEGAHTYQWYRRDNVEETWTKITGATRNSYTYTSEKIEKFDLLCKAYGISGMAESNVLTLTIMDGAPKFTTNLDAKYTLYGDQNLTLEVDASNLCTYQWYKCNDAQKTGAVAIENATSRTYKINKATAEGTYYYYCVATYTPAEGEPTVLTSNVATVTAELNDGRKLWVYGYYDQSASDGKGDSFIKNAVGTSNTIASTCDKSAKCTVEVNRTNYVSGYVFTPCGDHYNAPVAYGEFTANTAFVSTDKIKIGINSSASDNPSEQYGFYLCTENTKSDATLIKAIAIPNSAGKSLYEETIDVADYYEKLVGKTKLYLLPFTKDASNRKVTIHEVLVLSYPAADPVITTDIENAEYETPKGESVELSIKASYVKSYQWYTCTASDKSGEAIIEGATSANYTFSSKTDGTYYVFCRAEGLKADTRADSRVAKIVVTKGKKMAVFSYVAKNDGSDKYAEELIGGKYDIVVTSDENCSITKASANDKSSNKIFGLLSANKATTGHRNIHGYIKITLDTPLLEGDVFKFGTNTSSTDKPNSTYGFYLNNFDNNQTTGTKIANPANPSTATTENSGKNLWETTIDVPNELIGESVIYLHPFVGKDGANINLHELTITRFQLPEAPTFTTDLTTEYNDAIVGIKKTLTVAATGAESYQWYKNSSKTTEGATAIDGATEASYDFTATEAGDTYLYCVATNEVGSTTSTIAKVSAAAAPVFTTNLESEYTTERGTAKELTVEAVNATGYQWYINTKNSTDGAQIIPDATSKTYSCPAANLITRYYYCVATGSERNATSEIAKVTVVSGGGGEIFKFVYDGATLPTDDNNKVIPTTTGGTTIANTTSGFSAESATYNARVETEMKGAGSKGLKIGSSNSYLILQLTNGNFKTGDKIKITGYNPLVISTSTEHNGEISENLATGSSKSDYQVSSEVTIPADINAEKLYIKRQSGSGTGIAVISVSRAAEGSDVLTVDNYVGDTKTDAAGTVDVNGKAYVAGDEVLMTVTAGHGYKFDHWADAAGNAIAGATEPTYTATITEGGITFRAVFTELPAKTLTLKRYLNGVEVTEGTDVKVETVGDAYPTHPEGEKVKVKASVATGYSFLKWTSDVEGNNVLATTPEYTYTIGADNEQTIYAHFDSQYIVEFAKGDDVAVVGVAPKKIYLNKSGDKCNLPKNTSLYKAGHTLTGWKLKNSSPEVVKAPGDEYEVTSKGGNVFEPVFTANTVNWANRPSAVVVTWSAKDLNDSKITWQGNEGVYVSQVVYNGKTVDIPLFIDATTGKFGPNSNDWIQVNEGTKITFKSDATNLPALKKATIELTSKNAPQTATLNGVTQTSTFMSCKPKSEADVVFVADGKVGYLGDVKLTLPPLVSGDEIAIYKSSFDDWQGQVNENKNTVTTKDKKQKVTFTLNAVSASDEGTNTKFPTASPGYLMAAKSAADITTTEFHSISKIVFFHASTGSDRGYGLKVKGTQKNGTKDADWVILSDAKVNGGPNKVEVQVDRTDVQIQFYNLNTGQNAYLTDLAIYAFVTLEQCEDPEVVKGEWDPATVKWNYTVTASLPEDATVHYCKVSDGVDGAEQTGTDEVAIKIAPGEKYKFWTVDSYDDLPISNKVEITGDAMQKTVAPTLTVDPYSITGKTHKVTVSGLATGATAHYTVKDGEGNVVSGPTDYTGEFTITPGQTVEVYASQTHYANSDVVSKATTTITLPQKETFKSPGPGKDDTEVQVIVDSKKVGVDNILNSATIEGKYISGINGDTGLKYTINNTVGNIGDTDVKGIEIKVHDGYVINHVDVEGAYSNSSDDKTTSVKAIYVDGVKLEGFTQKDLPKYSSKQTIDFVIDGIEAKKSIILEMDDNISQARANISVTYNFIDEPATVAIKKSADGEAVVTIEAKDFTEYAYTYGATLDYIPVVEMTTKQGYVYTMQDKEVDGFNHTFKYTVMGKEYSVKTTVSVLSSPGITVDESNVSVAGGYPVTLSGAGTMYINIDNKKDGSDNLVWEQYDPAKKYYAVKYVKSYCVYNETSTKENPSEYEVSKNVYDYKKPFAVYVRQPSYLDSQDGSNPYNSLMPEAKDKIYQALQTNFNVVDCIVPSSTEILKKMPDIADAKLVVITEMISGSGSYTMQRPQDAEPLDTKSTALTMTLLRDVVDKTNVLNLKMFTYSQSKNNTDRWGWASPAALPSNVISISPVEPNGGGMYELFSEAKMNLDGSIALWDDINEDKIINHLQPVYNFNEGQHVPNFVPLAMAVDPDNPEEQYHILHYYDKETAGKKTTYVGFGLSVNEWTAYNDNIKAIIEKMGEMIVNDRPLNTVLDHIVDPKFTDNGDGSAMVMNNNFSAETYYLARDKGAAEPTAEEIATNGTKTLAENDFNTIKYTTDKVIWTVSKLGTAYSNVIGYDLKGSTTRYITRVSDDPEATGLPARYPFEVNTDGTAKEFSFPYNQSWKKDGYTVTMWIAEDGTEYTPGQLCATLTGDITVNTVWTENAHKITDLSKTDDKNNRTVTWEFRQSKGAPALALESKAGNMQAVLVGQAKFSDGTFIDVPMTVNTDHLATLPDNGTEYHGKFNNTSANWAKTLETTDAGTFTGSDYAQVRTGTQFTFPSVYGMNVVYKQVDLVEAVNGEANGNVNRSQVSQSYLTDGTTDELDAVNYWRFVNPGYQLTPGWDGEVLQPNSSVVFSGKEAQLAQESPITEKYKGQGADLKLYDNNGGNAGYGGLINYTGEGKMATLTSVESAQYVHVGDNTGKTLHGLNYGSVFMQSLSVTYPVLYDLKCKWIAVDVEQDPKAEENGKDKHKSSLDQNENPGKIEKLNDSHANCDGRFLLNYPVYLKLTPAYGYYVDVDNDEVKEDDIVKTPAYFFMKNGESATSALSFGTNEYIYRYKDTGYAGFDAAIKDSIPKNGAYIKMIVKDIDLVVSMKKLETKKYDFTAYTFEQGAIEFNTGNGRTPENEYDEFPVGKQIVVSATPRIGYRFVEWRLNCDPLNPKTTGSELTEMSGITFGTGVKETTPNPLVPGSALEKNQLLITVNNVNASNDQHYYAIFDKGVDGVAHYQFNYALEEYVDEQGDTQYRQLTLTDDDTNAFPDHYPSTSLNIPRYYTLYKEGYTLDHWIDNSTNHETEPDPAASRTYDIGYFYYFENEGDKRYLVPVFKKNPISYDHRAEPVDITWDFRTDKFAQEMKFLRSGTSAWPADKTIYYSTHALINNEHRLDVPLQITLGNKGKLRNDSDPDWCSIGEGTEIVIPSGIGAKFTVASLSRMTSTKFIEKDAFGNEVNSVVPTSYTSKTEDGVVVYYYTYTTESTSTNITLKIGSDYSYYKSIRAELPAADAVPLQTSVNNPAFGALEMTAAVHSDGSDRLSAIKKTMVADEQGGAAYTLGLGTKVTLRAKRNHLYVVDYFEDINGTKYYWDDERAGNVRAEAADGTDITASARANTGIEMAKVNDSNDNPSDNIALTFTVSSYQNSMRAVYKENKLYQINYSSGEEAEGEAPAVVVIEAGESFTVPKENHYLYVDGQTLKYWVDQEGNKYDFGQTYTLGTTYTNETGKTLPSGIEANKGFDVPEDDLFLTPHFEVNDFTVMNLTEEATAVWPLTRLGKSTSDDPKGNYDGNGNVVIYFQKSVGVYVTPLKLKDGRFIDLKLDINCAKTGKVDNQSNSERCQINGESLICVPSSSNCSISLYTVNGKLSTTKIAGADATTDAVEGGKTVATHYTSTTVSGSNDCATVNYTGQSTKVDIEFMGEAGYFYQIAATYKPVETNLPELDYVTINNIALGAIGTDLQTKKLSTLKNDYQLEDITADLSKSVSGDMPVVKATATNNGYVEITQATIDKPTATLLVKTNDGVTVSVHKIFFNVIPPEDAPIISDVKIGTKYQGDIDRIDADAIDINNKWSDVNPSGSYIYGYKWKTTGESGTTDEYIVNVENAGINGAISIRFNKMMKAASVKVPALKDQIITADEGQTLVFSYWNLDLNTTYDFKIPANTFEDIYGKKYAHPIRLNFTTVKSAMKVENRMVNYVVTHNQPVKWDKDTFGMVPDGEVQQIASTDLIKNLEAAGIPHGTLDHGIEMANAAKETAGERFYIFVPNGEYQLLGNTTIKPSYASSTYAPADNTGKLRDELLFNTSGKVVGNAMTEISRDNISITGQSEDKTIVWNRPEIEGISYTATFRLNSATSNFYAQDMTWENRFDFKTSIAKQGAASAQAARAVVLQDRSAKSIFKNVKLLSYQDTYYSNPTGSKEDTRYYFENCTFAGYVDFLCGSGDAWFEKCNLIVRGGKGTNASNMMAPAQYVTDEWGYIFNHCNVKADADAFGINNGKFTLARPWKESPAASLLYTTYYVQPTTDAYKAMSNTGQLLRIHEYKSYNPDGTLVDLSTRSLRNSSPGAGSYDAVMTPSEAQRYTVFNAMCGNDGYDPTIYTRQVDMTKNPLRQDDTSLTWEKEADALCYFIFRKNNEGDTDWQLYAVTDKLEFELPDTQLKKWFCIRAANQRGGLGEPTEPLQYMAHEAYTRELSDKEQVIDGWRWSTIYLDFNAKAPTDQSLHNGKLEDDIYVYALVEVEATRLHFQRVKTMEKNHGYLIKARPRDNEYIFKYTEKTPLYYYFYKPDLQSEGETLELTLEDYRTKKGYSEEELPVFSLMNGTVVDRPASDLAGYTLAYEPSYKLGFYKYKGTTYKANYAWIDAALIAEAQKKDEEALNSAAKYGFMKIVFDDNFLENDEDNIATDLNGIYDRSADGKIYNLGGQAVDPAHLQRGMIYIINGKKVKY